MLSQNNSKKKTTAKETAFDLFKNKQQFKNIILKSLMSNNNNKKIKKEKEDNNVNLSKIQKTSLFSHTHFQVVCILDW